MEDHLAFVFLVIVIAFFICHLPRIILSIHEMWTVNITIKCAQRGHWSFPIWALIMSQFSHFLLVINSSINCLIYCMLSSRFRKIVAQYAKKWGCYKPSPPPSIETPPEAAQPLNENNDEEVNRPLLKERFFGSTTQSLWFLYSFEIKLIGLSFYITGTSSKWTYLHLK